MTLVPVIMAGGSGSRLWPLSRELHPKQFLRLPDGQRTMLQGTLARLEGLPCAGPIVVSHEEHRFLVAEQLRQSGRLEQATILLEPIARGTAPAIATAALQALEHDPEAVLLVLSADQVLGDVAAFQQAALRAAELARQGWLVTFGVVPTRAETGYGYIERGEPLGEDGYRVARFVEKPDAERAAAFAASGAHYWNAGMFALGAGRYLEELERLAPAMRAACEQAVAGARPDLTFIRLDRAALEGCSADSIDYAVLEKTDRAAVVPLDAAWSDVGAWSALWEIGAKDGDGNVTIGDVLLHDVQGSYLHGTDRLVAAVGVRDVVLVETKDAVLLAHRDRAQDVRHIVQRLQAQNRAEHRQHREVYRPWGSFDAIHADARYQVKRITVNPGAQLSLQLHHHRAEHWIVVQGTARVTRGEETFLLTENQSTYIPVGQPHRLENPGVIPLVMIEVQTGSYLGEDDIVRLSDAYGRAGRA
ncbi:Mannose-1-phosphate guanylyltransferase RfbM [Tepidimonas sediminis]|uniref:mannose-1-phosphate guanylyltransferase n=1 Tax=Tepidimonas sediminis TaxID=2588941 RepID=A0A554WGQ2_9BURK|nr:mannose-1-phosphate guanylyltransferase/mannose-6-phosphate isomerase [Tepidimonas sediminis]TSE22746.1 Mannose-1-phosphate guanylyltransferase RfbM [Tepidimonas sediminis]